MLFKLNFYKESLGNCVSVEKSENFNEDNDYVYLRVEDYVKFNAIRKSSEILKQMEKMYGFLFVRDEASQKVYHMSLSKKHCLLVYENKYLLKIFSSDKIVGEINFK